MKKTIAQYMTNYKSKTSIGSYFRQRRAGLIIQLIKECYEQYGKVNIIDIGGRPSYWNIIPEEVLDGYEVKITLVNNSDELGQCTDRRFTSVVADGCKLDQFSAGSFQMAHCNSVIEHIGDWTNVVAMCQEIQRLAPTYYVQTPNFWFPIEPHFMLPLFHWLPKPIRVKMLNKWNLGHIGREPDILKAVIAIEEIRLMDNTMFMALFDNAQFKKERFLGLPKSLIAYQHHSQIKTDV
jgi:hypothetical protein